jgi:hypothetical protein
MERTMLSQPTPQAPATALHAALARYRTVHDLLTAAHDQAQPNRFAAQPAVHPALAAPTVTLQSAAQ